MIARKLAPEQSAGAADIDLKCLPQLGGQRRTTLMATSSIITPPLRMGAFLASIHRLNKRCGDTERVDSTLGVVRELNRADRSRERAVITQGVQGNIAQEYPLPLLRMAIASVLSDGEARRIRRRAPSPSLSWSTWMSEPARRKSGRWSGSHDGR